MLKKDPALNRILFKEIIKHLKDKAGIIEIFAPAKPEYRGTDNPVIIIETATGIYETGLNELITGDQIKQIV